MSFLLENLWIWCVLAFLILACGYTWYVNVRDARILGGSVGAAVLTLLLGLLLVWYAPTDRKNIQKTLDAIIAAVVADDIDKVFTHVTPRAEPVKKIARFYMGMVRVEKVNYRDLKIEFNGMTSPPTANVSLTAVVFYKLKMTGEGPFPEQVKIDLEFEKQPSAWIVSDCKVKTRI